MSNDCVKFVWHSNPPQEPVAKVLLRWTETDQEYKYILCRWIDNGKGALWLVDSEYGDDVPFHPGDQWMELEHEVPDNV